VSVTTLFDDAIFGDSDQFDTVTRYSIEIEEDKTIFDPAVFGDIDQFDTTRGGVIVVSDAIERLIATYRSPAAQSVSITDSISRLQNIFRTMTSQHQVFLIRNHSQIWWYL